jgi:hypothetical protein
MSQVVCAKDREAYSKMSQNIKAQDHYGAGCRGRDYQDSRNSSQIVKSRIFKAWDGIRRGLIKKSRFVIFSCFITVEYTCTRLGEVSVILYVCTSQRSRCGILCGLGSIMFDGRWKRMRWFWRWGKMDAHENTSTQRSPSGRKGWSKCTILWNLKIVAVKVMRQFA